jgi:uncharacterized protein DUF1647
LRIVGIPLKSPTVVTAASARCSRCLYQFLLSAERKRLTGAAQRFVVYDLGIESSDRQRLAQRFPWSEFRRFAFESYPGHVALERRSYAWKPLIIRDLCGESDGPLLWLDSAAIFQTDDLSPVWSKIQRHAAYVLKGQSPLGQRCDPATLDALGVSAGMRQQPECAAGMIGLDCARPPVRRLLEEWCSQTLTEGVIAPRDPPLSLHRHEQSLLSILLYRYAADGHFRLTDEEIDISSGSPVEWMTSRNKVPPGMPLWADPLVRAYYRSYKAIDQMLWRRQRRVGQA